MNDQRIGRIARVNICRRRDDFGFFVHLSGEGWGVNHFVGGKADPNPPIGDDPDEYFDDRMASFASALNRAERMCRDAKVASVAELKGKPVVVVFDEDGDVRDWRILVEAIG